MELEFSLNQLLGLYFIIVGGIVLYRRKSIMPAMQQLVNSRPLLLVIALAEILAGLAIVLTYPTISATPDGVVSIIGWMLIVEGIVYLALPYKTVHKFVRSFGTPQWYGVGGVLAVLIGLYLAGSSFGFIG
jgi:hypothetical protein